MRVITESQRAKADSYPQSIKESFVKWSKYSDNMDFDPGNNFVGVKAHATRLYNKFFNLCIDLGFDTIETGAILSHVLAD